MRSLGAGRAVLGRRQPPALLAGRPAGERWRRGRSRRGCQPWCRAWGRWPRCSAGPLGSAGGDEGWGGAAGRGAEPGGSGRGAALRVRGAGLPARLEVRRGELRRGARREGPSRPWRGGCTRDPRHGARRAAARCEGRRGRCEARSRGKARGTRGGGDEVRRVAAVPRCRLLASPPRAQAQASSRLGRRR